MIVVGFEFLRSIPVVPGFKFGVFFHNRKMVKGLNLKVYDFPTDP